MTASSSGEGGGQVAGDATQPLGGGEVEAPALRSGLPHSTWERYAILSFVGEGGMGRVYKGHDPRLQRHVALKFLGAGGRGSTARLLREAQLQARVDHPGICKVYEVGEVDGEPFIAMQFIAGRTLAAMQDELDVGTKIRIIEEVARAAHAAHALGLIHRDLKPGNIMLEPTADGGLKPYIMDFGLAREVSTPGLTVTGDVLGTPSYMAPEQASGRGTADARTDVYGLGATLYCLLTGRPPFEGSVGEVLAQVLREDPPSVRQVTPEAPFELETIVARCIDKEPGRRYPSALALADDLRRFQDGEAIQARRASVAYRLRKKARKHRAAFAVGAVALVAGALALGLWLRDRGRAERRAHVAQRFGQEVERIRSALRRAYSLPLHDVRKDMALVRASLLGIEREMRGLGDLAGGAGEFALGCGHLSLKELEPARVELEAAWRAGYREPEVAYALGQALGGLYRDRLIGVERTADAGERERRRREVQEKYRDPALAWLRQGGSAGEDPAYAEALIAFYEGRLDEALAGAQQVAGRLAWLYEARVLEGDVQTARSRQAYNVGDLARATAGAELALAAYRAAADLARSDPTVYTGVCSSLGWLMSVRLRQGQPIDELHRDALAACDHAIAADADLAAPYYEKLRLQFMLASLLARSGGDPGAALDAAEALATEVVRRDPAFADAYAGLGNVRRLRAQHLMARGRDPRAAFAGSVAAFEEGMKVDPRSFVMYNDIGISLAMLAGWEASSGVDPRASMDRAAAALARAVELAPEHLNTVANLASLRADKASYEMRHGIDPRATLAQALADFGRVAAASQDYAYRDNIGRAHLQLARWAAAGGEDPLPHLARARAAFEEGLAQNPKAGGLLQGLALAETMRAEHLLGSEDAVAAAAHAAELGRAAVALDANQIEHHTAVAHAELAGARAARARGRSPAERFAAAEAALAPAPADSVEAARARADLYRFRADWRLDARAPAAADIAQGLAAARRAAAGDDPEAAALTGALLLLDARARRDPTRAAEAAAALAAAIARDVPLLAREYGPLREEAERLAAGK